MAAPKRSIPKPPGDSKSGMGPAKKSAPISKPKGTGTVTYGTIGRSKVGKTSYGTIGLGTTKKKTPGSKTMGSR